MRALCADSARSLVPPPRGPSAPTPSSPRLGLALWVLALLAWAPACASSASSTGYEHYNEQIADELTKVGLGPGDVFEVTVYGEESLSRTLRVSPEGDVHFPFINRIHVAGLTTVEIEDLIRTRLQDGFIREPSVTVFVKEYNSKKIFVLGEVARAGTFAYSAGMTIVEAISLAGGFKESANTDNVVVTRRAADGTEQRIAIPVEQVTRGLAANLTLQPGDIVFVPGTLL